MLILLLNSSKWPSQKALSSRRMRTLPRPSPNALESAKGSVQWGVTNPKHSSNARRVSRMWWKSLVPPTPDSPAQKPLLPTRWGGQGPGQFRPGPRDLQARLALSPGSRERGGSHGKMRSALPTAPRDSCSAATRTEISRGGGRSLGLFIPAERPDALPLPMGVPLRSERRW